LIEAVQGSPTSGDVQFHVAVVEAELGRLADARNSLKKALDLDAKLTNREDVKTLQTKLAGR
jgi:Flp pilus assembly protein TadD